jgi:hypothetical protein
MMAQANAAMRLLGEVRDLLAEIRDLLKNREADEDASWRPGGGV